MEQSFSLLFFLKSSKKDSRAIYARITVDGQPKEFSTKRFWEVGRWDFTKGRAIGTREDARIVNSYLDVVTSKVMQARKELLEKDLEITAERLKNKVLGLDKQVRTILQVFEDHNTRMEELIGKDYSKGTHTNFKTTLRHTRSFIAYRYKKADLDIESLDYNFIAEFAHWFKTVANCSHNTTMKNLANFKKVVIECLMNGWLQKDPFYRFKLARKEVDIEALEQEEINRIWKREFNTERLGIVRDVFIFSCYTGLAYSDVKRLKRNQIIVGSDGKEWIVTNRQKTGRRVRIPLLSIAKEILQRYQNDPKCISKGLALPVSSNQKINEYLKEIAVLCQITKKLNFHLARHTFATIMLNNGVPIETVRELLGHKTIKQTQHYARVLDAKIREGMDMVESRMSRPNNAVALNLPSIQKESTTIAYELAYDVRVMVRLSERDINLISRVIDTGESPYENQPGGFWFTIKRRWNENKNEFLVMSISDLDRVVLKSLEHFNLNPDNRAMTNALVSDLQKILTHAIKDEECLNSGSSPGAVTRKSLVA